VQQRSGQPAGRAHDAEALEDPPVEGASRLPMPKPATDATALAQNAAAATRPSKGFKFLSCAQSIRGDPVESDFPSATSG
jgi:hypothetical protein